MTASRKLLAEYATRESEEAFRELVRLYLDLVYTTALRLVDGDAHRAEDVAQTVFGDLARKAGTLSDDVMIGGWLHRHTCFVASKLMRSERRRRLRERQAVEMNAQEDHSRENLAQVSPALDEAINALGAEDRLAILLRFFERRDLRSVGAALGASENAAQKRIVRALEQLRQLLARRGVVLSAAALGTTLTANAVAVAPAGLIAGISTSALAGAATGTGATGTLIKLVTMNKLQVGIISALVVAAVIVPVASHRQAGLRAENRALLDQIGNSPQSTAPPAAMTNPPDSTADQAAEINRLTAELARLRQQISDLQNPANAAGLWSNAQAQAYADAINSGTLLSTQELQAGFPRDSWVFSGYGTPKATMQSLMWAMSHGDTEALFRGYTSNALWVKLGSIWKGKTESEIAELVQNSMQGISRFKVQRQRTADPATGEPLEARVVFNLTPISGEGKELGPVNFSIERVGDEWKSVNTRGGLLRLPPGQP